MYVHRKVDYRFPKFFWDVALIDSENQLLV
jgi:hypothetical protein